MDACVRDEWEYAELDSYSQPEGHQELASHLI